SRRVPSFPSTTLFRSTCPLVKRRADERRLSGSGFSDENGQARPRCEPIAQMGECFPVLSGEKQKPGIRRQIERPNPRFLFLTRRSEEHTSELQSRGQL